MVEPPPRDPPDPAEDETVIADSWGPDETVVVEQEEVVEEPPRRLPELWPWLLALLVLVLAGLAAAYFLSRDDDEGSTTTTAATSTAQTSTAAEQVSVPDVVGTTSSEATATLQNAGFEVNLVPVPSDRAPGTVVAQSPAAGSEQPEGSSVRINVAEEAATTTEATTTETTGTTTEEEETTTAPPAPQPATVPDVVGQELADAGRAFSDEGLKASVIYVPSQEPAGQVVAQAQPAGASRPRGSNVQLNVSAGPEAGQRAPVPSVTGRSLADARDALEAAGFEVLALTLGDDDVRNESTVASQSPVGGATAPSGALVLLYV